MRKILATALSLSILVCSQAHGMQMLRDFWGWLSSGFYSSQETVAIPDEQYEELREKFFELYEQMKDSDIELLRERFNDPKSEIDPFEKRVLEIFLAIYDLIQKQEEPSNTEPEKPEDAASENLSYTKPQEPDDAEPVEVLEQWAKEMKQMINDYRVCFRFDSKVWLSNKEKETKRRLYRIMHVFRRKLNHLAIRSKR